MDAWDRAALRVSGPRAGRGAKFADLGRRFLQSRGDAALGLAPLRLLDPAGASRWLLFWTAARRVDDSVEAGATTVEHWETALDAGSRDDLATNCVQTLLDEDGPLRRSELVRLFRRGLEGLRREAPFAAPRPERDYLALLELKSVPAMTFLDHLLFPHESSSRLRPHARAFARTTQIGDDCRDALRDLTAGRCFVTREEITEPGLGVQGTVRQPFFVRGRVRRCRFFLAESDRASRQFVRLRSRTRAEGLASLWRFALDSGQVRPTRRHLRLPAGTPRIPSAG